MDLFLQTEQALYENDPTHALGLLTSVTVTNGVEANYVLFYTIYANYLGAGLLTATDSRDLISLTQFYPANDGACIQQARALYDQIFQIPQRYPEYCNEDDDRIRQNVVAKKNWELSIFPNSASNKIHIKNNMKEDLLLLEIKDLSGRLILKREVKVSDFIGTLDLNLISGAYIVTVSTHNESIVKKLLISK